jgi:hypothetical protein
VVRPALIAALLAIAGCGRSGTLLEEALPGPEIQPPITLSPTPTPEPTPVLCDARDPALLACFPFDASASDASSYGVMPVTANLAFAPGVDGSALSFTAASGFVLPDANAFDLPDMTFEMWFAASQLPATRFGLIDKDGQYGLFLQANGAVTCSGAGTPAALIAATDWHHVACVIGTGSVKIYVDGLVLGTAAGVAANTGGDGVHLGENGTAGDDQFLGFVDRFRVWDDLRTAEEICAEAQTCPE